MKPRTFTALFAVVTICVLCAFGIAIAQTAHQSQRLHEMAHVSALDHTARLSAAQRREWRRMRRQMAQSHRIGIAATADYSAAHPVPLPDGYGDAWVIPAPDGAVCTLIPDPSGGYGSSCATEDDLASGGAVTMLGGAGELEGRAITVIVVPDETAAPVITTPDGDTQTANFDGLGAEILPARSTLRVGARQVIVPEAP